MKIRPRVAWLVVISFFLFTSCGGGSGNGGHNNNDDDTAAAVFGSLLTTTTDADGSASITSANSDKRVELSIHNTAEKPIEGLDVEYVDTEDRSAGQMIISDPNGIYQTTLVTFSADDLSANVVATTLSGERVDAFIVTTATLITVALALLAAKSAVEIGYGIYKLAGDPPTISYYGDQTYACVSPSHVFTTLNIGINAIGLLTAGSISGAAEAVGEGSKTALEVIGSQIAPDAAAAVGLSLGEYLTNMRGYDSDKKYCLLLIDDLSEQSERYTKAADLTGEECTSDGECEGVSENETPDKEAVDSDEDGYTPAEGDCDDYNKLFNPAAKEICGNDVDEDCDGEDAECDPDIEIDIASPPYSEPGSGLGTECPSEAWDSQAEVCYGDERALITTATITGTDFPYAYIVVNGLTWKSYIDPVTHFVSTGNPVLLRCSTDMTVNAISVILEDDEGNQAVKQIARGCDAEATDLSVYLFWNKPSTNLDLYVKEPSGEFAYDDKGASTSDGGTVEDHSGNYYGPAYYTIADDAPAGRYKIRIHYKNGSTEPTYTLYIVPDENFDHAFVATGTLSHSNAAKAGTANFTGSDNSWSTYTWTITKNSNGHFGLVTTE
jgi:hypothetical protein